jgi:hypothetical protein
MIDALLPVAALWVWDWEGSASGKIHTEMSVALFGALRMGAQLRGDQKLLSPRLF